jgi:hypothetical protein
MPTCHYARDGHLGDDLLDKAAELIGVRKRSVLLAERLKALIPLYLADAARLDASIGDEQLLRHNRISCKTAP